ncbi:hypothetical protein HDV01_006098 [Terramyces sp. JEL0728]|nr:hypothetical protein HDV01_006098 [Terramyces sp. JEL0728]
MNIRFLPKDLLYYIRLNLSIRDLDNFNIAIYQSNAPVPKPLVDEWFIYQFNKGWKVKFLLAYHPSTKQTSKALLQNTLFNFSKFTRYKLEQNKIKRIVGPELFQLVRLYVENQLVDPGKEFILQDFDCFHCSLFNECWCCQDPYTRQHPIVMATKYSWDLVGYLLDKVDPHVQENIVLKRAVLTKNHLIVKRLAGKKIDSCFDEFIQITIKGYVFKITLQQMVKFYGWKDVLAYI